MARILPKPSIVSGISELYSKLLDIAVYLSSFSFFGFGFSLLTHKDPVYVFLVMAVIFVILGNEKLPRKVREISKCFLEAVAILASIIILFLFLNLYLTFSNPLTKCFLAFKEIAEDALNQFVIKALFMFVSLFVLFYCVFHLLALIVEKAKTANKVFYKLFYGAISIIVELALIVLFFYFYSSGDLLSDFLYSKIGWIFGFSLSFLHLRYLIKESKRIFQRGKNQSIIE